MAGVSNTNVARASLEELLEDYRDYLRTGGHALWDKDSKDALYVRKLGCDGLATYETYRSYYTAFAHADA